MVLVSSRLAVVVDVALSYARQRHSHRHRRRVCLSHAGNASKLMNIGSCGFYPRYVAQRFEFF